jgi:DNA-binding NarL/FixJ family response regulator
MGTTLAQAHAMGARGLVTKFQVGQTLVDCVRTVMTGHTWLAPVSNPPSSAAQASSGQSWQALLTARERIVARLVIEGLSNKRIASRLNITEGTTKLHLHHIYQKLQCSGRMALMVLMRDSAQH